MNLGLADVIEVHLGHVAPRSDIGAVVFVQEAADVAGCRARQLILDQRSEMPNDCKLSLDNPVFSKIVCFA